MNAVKDDIGFLITPEQATQICQYYGLEEASTDECKICELLDRLIDEVTM